LSAPVIVGVANAANSVPRVGSNRSMAFREPDRGDLDEIVLLAGAVVAPGEIPREWQEPRHERCASGGVATLVIRPEQPTVIGQV
jgi:predicted fused transcriptional regulator/phosphomethylpyrimidine kinase